MNSQSALANGDIKVLGALTQEKVGNIGESYSDTILLKNTGQASCEVKIYQTDYLFRADGSNFYSLPGSNPLSNAKWITLSASSVTIPPGQTAPVNYHIKIPQSEDLHGTYWSLVMVEPVETKSVPSAKGKYTLGLKTNIRYGVQIVTNIKDTGARRIEILNKKIVDEKGHKFLQFDIINTGERWLDPSVSVQLYNKEGKLLGPFIDPKSRIFPTCSVRHKIFLRDIGKGDYKAQVIVDNGDQYVFGANYELTIR